MLEVQGLQVAYGAVRAVRDVSLTLAEGELVTLLGANGAGKSSTLMCVAGALSAAAGSIRLDGIELARLDRKYLRGQVAAVLQEPFLYSKTVRDNIKFGRPDAAEDEMLEAAVVAAPDPDRGSIVKAFVVLRPGIVGDEGLVEALQAHVKSVTAPYKYPRRIELLDELPKTVSGKIRRVELRKRT